MRQTTAAATCDPDHASVAEAIASLARAVQLSADLLGERLDELAEAVGRLAEARGEDETAGGDPRMGHGPGTGGTPKECSYATRHPAATKEAGQAVERLQSVLGNGRSNQLPGLLVARAGLAADRAANQLAGLADKLEAVRTADGEE